MVLQSTMSSSLLDMLFIHSLLKEAALFMNLSIVPEGNVSPELTSICRPFANRRFSSAVG